MRKVFCLLVVVALAGCGGPGGLSSTDQSTIEGLIRLPNDKGTADSLHFSDWDSTTVEDGGKTWRVVRVKYTGKKGGDGEAFSRDILVRYAGEPLLPLDELDNKAGNDWKKDVKSLKWAP